MGYDKSAIARRFFEQLISKGNFSLLDELVAKDAVLRDGMLPEGQGHEYFQGVIAGWRTAFPDLAFLLDDVIVAGDQAIVKWIARGTFTGPMMGITPNNKAMLLRGCEILRISGGKIVEDDSYWDAYGLFQQLGLIPSLDELGEGGEQVAGAQPHA